MNNKMDERLINKNLKEQIDITIMQRHEQELQLLANNIDNTNEVDISEIHLSVDSELEKINNAIGLSTENFTNSSVEIEPEELLERLEDTDEIIIEEETDLDNVELDEIALHPSTNSSTPEASLNSNNDVIISIEQRRYELELKDIQDGFKNEDYFTTNYDYTYSEAEENQKNEHIKMIMDTLAVNSAKHQFVGSMELQKSELGKFLALFPKEVITACYEYCQGEKILGNAPLEVDFWEKFNTILSINNAQRLAKGYSNNLYKTSIATSEHIANVMSIKLGGISEVLNNQLKEIVKAMATSARIQQQLIEHSEYLKNNVVDDCKTELDLYVNQANLKYLEDFQKKGNYIVKEFNTVISEKVDSSHKEIEKSFKRTLAQVNKNIDEKLNLIKNENTLKPYIFMVATSLISSVVTAILIKVL